MSRKRRTRSRYPCARRLATGPLLLAVLGLAPIPPGHAAEATEHPEAGGHHFDRPFHTLGVFLGDTTEDRRVGLTLGLEYEYRASERYGIGLTAEHVAGDFDTNVLVVPLAFHRGPWKFYAGPGVERGEEGSEPLLRVGVEYGFHFGEFELSPQLDLDYVDGERLFVFGVVFARKL